MLQQRPGGGGAGTWYQPHASYKYAGMGVEAGPAGPPLMPAADERRGVYWPGIFGSITALIVLLFTGMGYNLVFLGRVLPACDKSDLAVLFGCVFNPLWLLALWSYFQASFADPGYLPQPWRQFVAQMGIQLPVVQAQHSWQMGVVTSCEKCGVPRPDRAHHCKVCNACVMRMDHHCPWINNCVGMHNHKFFVQLVLYGCSAAVVGVLTCAPWLLFCLSAIRRDDGYALEPVFSLGEGISSSVVRFDLSVREAWAFLLDCALGLAVAVLLGLLGFGVVPNLLSNVTTIEQNYPRNMNPFDQESAIANLAQVFGATGPDWLIPVSPWQPVCDGLVFPARGAPPLHGQAQGEALWHLWYTGAYKGRAPASVSRPGSFGGGSPSRFAGLIPSQMMGY